MRNEKELLELLLEYIDTDLYVSGLCSLTRSMWLHHVISKLEWDWLDNMLEVKKPVDCYDEDFYFSPFDIEPRKEFIRNIISNIN